MKRFSYFMAALFFVTGCGTSDGPSLVCKNSSCSSTVSCDATAIPFGGGNGSLAHPFAICSQTQLKNISTSLSSNFVLATSLTLSGTFTPIGPTFSGGFDGNKKKITGLTLDGSATEVGLFVELGAGAEVKHLGLESVTIAGGTSGNNIGPFAGTNNGTILGVYAKGTISGADMNAGGVVGQNTGSIQNSYSQVNITDVGGGSPQTGGIAAFYAYE